MQTAFKAAPPIKSNTAPKVSMEDINAIDIGKKNKDEEEGEDDEELKSLDIDADDCGGDSSYEEGDVKRISSSSRVNFTKLTKKEQAARFRNMQKKI